MTAPAVSTAAGEGLLDPCTAHLGHALALIQRVLPRLEDVGAADQVDRVLERASAEVQEARAVHRQRMAALRPAPVESEVLALVAAAVAVALEGATHRVLEVRRSTPVVTWVNAWAIEGRFQHYSSHKVR
ncbi:MAG: hypothetical protein IT580_19020 [Verrucomicrobiales bacterium]|nr:hypothetical protein [Verrucomicrobiales bacterium]